VKGKGMEVSQVMQEEEGNDFDRFLLRLRGRGHSIESYEKCGQG